MARPHLKISVPEPCSEDWNAMTPGGKGRFCGSCAKIVIDFSQYSDQELLDFFANQNDKTCGRFLKSQLGFSVFNEPEPAKAFFSIFAAGVAFFIGISTQLQAQSNNFDHPVPKSYKEAREMKINGRQKMVAETPEKVNADSLFISGKVIDKLTGEGLPFVPVQIKNSDLGASTDSNGQFKIFVSPDFQSDEVILVTKYVGYERSETLVSKLEITNGQIITLETNIQELNVFFAGGITMESYRFKPWQTGFYTNLWWRTKNLFRKQECIFPEE